MSEYTDLNDDVPCDVEEPVTLKRESTLPKREKLTLEINQLVAEQPTEIREAVRTLTGKRLGLPEIQAVKILVEALTEGDSYEA